MLMRCTAVQHSIHRLRLLLLLGGLLPLALHLFRFLQLHQLTQLGVLKFLLLQLQLVVLIPLFTNSIAHFTNQHQLATYLHELQLLPRSLVHVARGGHCGHLLRKLRREARWSAGSGHHAVHRHPVKVRGRSGSKLFHGGGQLWRHLAGTGEGWHAHHGGTRRWDGRCGWQRVALKWEIQYANLYFMSATFPGANLCALAFVACMWHSWALLHLRSLTHWCHLGKATTYHFGPCGNAHLLRRGGSLLLLLLSHHLLLSVGRRRRYLRHRRLLRLLSCLLTLRLLALSSLQDPLGIRRESADHVRSCARVEVHAVADLDESATIALIDWLGLVLLKHTIRANALTVLRKLPELDRSLALRDLLRAGLVQLGIFVFGIVTPAWAIDD